MKILLLGIITACSFSTFAKPELDQSKKCEKDLLTDIRKSQPYSKKIESLLVNDELIRVAEINAQTIFFVEEVCKQN